jgi:enoyl-CoA hydratase
MSYARLIVEKSGGVATLTLNRPEAMNALSAELRGEMTRAFRELRKDEETRVLILTGAGRAFCAGMDLKELASGALGGDAAASGSDIDVGLIPAIQAFEGPIIAAVNGHAVTAGFELALACDVLIASTEAKFADTHLRVGMLPGWGLSQRLPRLIGISRAKELSFTGNFLSAEQAESWGLVNRVVSPEELLPTCRALAEDMLSVDEKALPACKQLIDHGYGLSFEEAMAHERKVAVEAASAIRADTIAARRESIQRRGRDQGGES